MESLLTVTQAAERLDVHRTRVHAMIKAGMLPATRTGSVLLIQEADLVAFKSLARKPGRPPKLKAEAQPVGAAELKQPQQLVAGAAGQGAANGAARAETKPRKKAAKKRGTK